LTGDDSGRGELAGFLRSRRERIDPTQVGLPKSRRRRSRGLRREEVAVLAGVSPTWYTYLEQGRNIRPSPAVLDSLARVLLLTEDERHYMHMLVFGHPPRARTLPAPAVSMAEMVGQLVECYGHGAHPMYVFDEIGDVLAWNDATAEWYTDFGRMPVDQRNMMWWVLTSPEARERLGNWEEDCRDVVARYRSYVAMRHNDPRISQFIARLQEASPEFAKWWVEHEVHGQSQRPRLFKHPTYGTRTMHIQVMVPTETDNVRVAFHLPAGTTDSA
jgi:transcriptional regulator with XRE-family HTH domain